MKEEPTAHAGDTFEEDDGTIAMRPDGSDDSPTEDPAAEDGGTAGKKGKRRGRIVAAGAAAVLATALGGGYAYAAYAENGRLEDALAGQSEALSGLARRAGTERAYVKSVEAGQLDDPSLLDGLSKLIDRADRAEAVTADVRSWDYWSVRDALKRVEASTNGVDDLAGGLEKQHGLVAGSIASKRVKTLKGKLEKALKDADALYKSSDGKVADGKTRDVLKKEIDRARRTVKADDPTVDGLAKRADSLADAVKAVKDSVKAKAAADEKARTESQTAASGGSASGGSAAGGSYAGAGYSNGAYSNNGYSGYSGGNAGGYSAGNGGVSGGSQSGGGADWSWVNDYKDSAGGGASMITPDNIKGDDIVIGGDSQGNMW